MRTRLAVSVGFLAALGGCGFHPLYAPSGVTNTALGAVYVDIIPNRPGQLLRQALQARLEGDGSVTSKKYELSVAYGLAADVVGIQADSSNSRTRYVGTALWTLKEPGFLGKKITTGNARAVDGSNVIDAQFFYFALQSEAIDKRMSDLLADQIVQELAVYFRAHPEHA